MSAGWDEMRGVLGDAAAAGVRGIAVKVVACSSTTVEGGGGNYSVWCGS